MIWIEQAMIVGAEVVVRNQDRMCRIDIHWPHNAHMTVFGKSLEVALKKLDAKLQDDATQEMIDKGAV